MTHRTRAAFLVTLLAAAPAISSADEKSAVLAGGGVDCLTCPADITVPSEPFQCSAIVEFATTSTCPDAVTCDHPSGSRFDVGSTQVYCNAGTADACTFNVIVTESPCGCGLCGIAMPLTLSAVSLAFFTAKCTRRLRFRRTRRHQSS